MVNNVVRKEGRVVGSVFRLQSQQTKKTRVLLLLPRDYWVGHSEYEKCVCLWHFQKILSAAAQEEQCYAQGKTSITVSRSLPQRLFKRIPKMVVQQTIVCCQKLPNPKLLDLEFLKCWPKFDPIPSPLPKGNKGGECPKRDLTTFFRHFRSFIREKILAKFFWPPILINFAMSFCLCLFFDTSKIFSQRISREGALCVDHYIFYFYYPQCICHLYILSAIYICST